MFIIFDRIVSFFLKNENLKFFVLYIYDVAIKKNYFFIIKLSILEFSTSDLCRNFNLNFFNMEVITIETQVFKELMAKINTIAKFVSAIQAKADEELADFWVDSYEVCTFLKVSAKTLQRLAQKTQIFHQSSFIFFIQYKFHARQPLII